MTKTGISSAQMKANILFYFYRKDKIDKISNDFTTRAANYYRPIDNSWVMRLFLQNTANGLFLSLNLILNWNIGSQLEILHI